MHTMKDEDIQGKVDWIEGQVEENLDFANASPRAGNCVVKELAHRLKEVVIEYKRLAGDYLEYRRQVKEMVKSVGNALVEWT